MTEEDLLLIRATLVEALEKEEFFNLMQMYRHTPLLDTKGTTEAFEAVKVYVLDTLSLGNE